jgi:hypothetical protein
MLKTSKSSLNTNKVTRIRNIGIWHVCFFKVIESEFSVDHMNFRCNCQNTLLSFFNRGPQSHRVKVKGTFRLAVYRQSVHLGAKPLETHDQRFLFGN